MPVYYRIDHELKTVFTTLVGVLTDAHVQHYKDTLLNDPEFDPAYNELVDFREVTELELTPQFIKSFAMHTRFSKTAMEAIVAPRDVVFGTARMYHAFRENISARVKIFRDMDEARSWLNLD